MIGPISTEKVIEKILDGTIQGDEQIQKYPQGQWQEIVKENTFFEAFVEVIEKTRIKKKEVNPRTLEETVIVPNAALSDGQNLTPKEGFGSNKYSGRTT